MWKRLNPKDAGWTAGLREAIDYDLFVEDITADVDDEPKRKPLARFLDQEDQFLLLFSNLSFAYIEGSLFRDDAMLAGGATFLAHLESWAALARATDEKGRFTRTQTEFDADSVFGILVNEIADHTDILVCDDLSDEWADFIAVHTTTQPSTVSFYHANTAICR